MFEDFEAGDVVTATVLINAIVKSKTKTKKDYIRLTLNDGKNAVIAFLWDTNKIDFNEGDTVKIKGTLGFYDDKPKLDLIEITESKQKINLPSLSEDDRTKFIERFNKIRSLVDDDELIDLLDAIFDNENIWNDFINAPAAKSNHQVYLGGLLEHTVEVAELCKIAYNLSPKNINLSLLLTGALLHDIGKIKEYSYDSKFDRTTTGKLVGHTSLSVIIVTRMMPESLSTKKFTEVIHLLLSHHGKREWGAPVEPLMKEAVLIHQSDMLSSYSSRYDIVKSENKTTEWSNFDKSYNRSWYLASINEDE